MWRAGGTQSRQWWQLAWWEPRQSGQEGGQETQGLQELTAELAALELQIVAMHPNVQREAKGLRDATQLAELRNGANGGVDVGWRDTDAQREA